LRIQKTLEDANLKLTQVMSNIRRRQRTNDPERADRRRK
jgi:hypothetical protein